MTHTEGSPAAPAKISWHLGRLVIAWVLAALVALAVVFWAPASLRFEWIAAAIGVTMLVSFILQLGTAQKQGFITRLSYSVLGGAFIIGVVELVTFLVTGR